MKRTALFAGSFDPFTVGHQRVVEKGLRMFDRVVVGVGVHPSKASFLPLDGRVELIRRVFEREPRVVVAAYTGLTGDFALAQGASFLLRGMRSGGDFEYELQLAEANAALYPELETVFVAAPAEVAFVSSSLVREVFSAGGNVSKLIPENIDLKKYL